MIQLVSKSQVLFARLAVVLIIAFIVADAIWYGVSAEVRQRVWQNLLDRPGGPMTFRFILQPCMAAIAALHDGVTDAKSGALRISGRSSPIHLNAVVACTKD